MSNYTYAQVHKYTSLGGSLINKLTSKIYTYKDKFEVFTHINSSVICSKQMITSVPIGFFLSS